MIIALPIVLCPVIHAQIFYLIIQIYLYSDSLTIVTVPVLLVLEPPLAVPHNLLEYPGGDGRVVGVHHPRGSGH